MKILNDASIVNNLTVIEDVSARDVFLTDNNLYIGDLHNDLQHNGVPESEKSKWTLSYNATTRVFTVTLSANSYYYVNGKKFTLNSGTHNWTAHTNTSGIYFFYFDINGIKTVSSGVWDILNTVQVGVVKYNSANDGGAAAGLLMYELHGMVMSPAVHQYEHLTEGTRLISGGGISGFTLDTSTLAAVTWGLSTSTIADEDIFTTVPEQSESNYLLGYFDASLNFNWRLSASLPFFTDGTNIQYNQIGVGLTSLNSNNTFVNYYIILLNANTPSQRTLVIPGQAVYDSLAEAQQESPANLNLGELPFQEYVFLYQITMKWIAAGSIAVGKAVIAANPVRQTSSRSTIVSAASDHNLLSNRNVLGAHLAGAIQTDDSLFSGILTPAFDISVQQSLQSLSTRAVDKNMFTTAGDIVYASATNTPVRLGKGTDGQVLKLVSGLPSWQTDNDTIYTHPSHTGEVTGASALTITADAVTNAKLANMAVNTIKGRITAGTGDPEDLTAANVRTILNVADGAQVNQTITSGNGMNFTSGSGNITITLGTPTGLTASTTDAVSTNGHTHSIATAIAVSLSNASTNAVGTSSSLARADHTHAITGFALSSHTHSYDNYGSWTLKANTEATGITIGSGAIVDIIGGTNVTVVRSTRTLTISSVDTVYTHPTGDGNLHVPATGTTNNGKVLTAGATAGSLSWQSLPTDYLSSSGTSEQTASVSVLKVQSTTSTERFEIDFNETLQSLDFCYYIS